jgi:ferredoxin, 2Fe-2S
MEENVTLYVQDDQGQRQALELPTDMGLSLMEALKASDYPIAATCGGMALCATCHVQILEGPELPEPSDDEAYMLDSLPIVTTSSRLSCQIRLRPELDGMVMRLVPVE